MLCVESCWSIISMYNCSPGPNKIRKKSWTQDLRVGPIYELEVGPRSGPYLLVCIKRRNKKAFNNAYILHTNNKIYINNKKEFCFNFAFEIFPSFIIRDNRLLSGEDGPYALSTKLY